METKRYIQDVVAHSRQTPGKSLYPGETYNYLATFFNRSKPRQSRDELNGLQLSQFPSTSEPAELANGHRSPFVRFLRLNTSGNSRCEDVTDLAHLAELSASCDKPERENDDSRDPILLFLSGFPSPSWLSAVGSAYEIDPAFFQTHLNFRSSGGRNDYYALPALPSAMNGVVRLHVISIGSRSVEEKMTDQNEVDKLRDTVRIQMDRYMHRLSTNKGMKVGDSIVRSCNLHDEKHFTVEQEITLCIRNTPSAWTGVVWEDFGNDIGVHLDSPWYSLQQGEPTWRPVFHPTVQHLPDIALKWRKYALLQDSNPPVRFFQSASLLKAGYGRSLDAELMRTDAFYAFHELFVFAANSTCQFLNLIDDKISIENSYLRMEIREYTLSNLFHYQDILNVQTRQLRDTIRAIQIQGSPSWPRAKEERLVEKAESAARSLLIDYEELLRRAEILSARCQSSMAMVMNKASITESKRAISQAEKVEQLTTLAFFYIPVSFTTSFFGMNLGIIGQGTLALWIWFAVSIPVTVLSYGVLKLLTVRIRWPTSPGLNARHSN